MIGDWPPLVRLDLAPTDPLMTRGDTFPLRHTGILPSERVNASGSSPSGDMEELVGEEMTPSSLSLSGYPDAIRALLPDHLPADLFASDPKIKTQSLSLTLRKEPETFSITGALLGLPISRATRAAFDTRIAVNENPASFPKTLYQFAAHETDTDPNRIGSGPTS